MPNVPLIVSRRPLLPCLEMRFLLLFYVVFLPPIDNRELSFGCDRRRTLTVDHPSALKRRLEQQKNRRARNFKALASNHHNLLSGCRELQERPPSHLMDFGHLVCRTGSDFFDEHHTVYLL